MAQYNVVWELVLSHIQAGIFLSRNKYKSGASFIQLYASHSLNIESLRHVFSPFTVIHTQQNVEDYLNENEKISLTKSIRKAYTYEQGAIMKFVAINPRFP